MKSQMKMVAAAILAASLVGSNAYAGDPPAPPAKKRAAKTPPKPSVEDQINALRQEFQGQIDGLKSDLAAKDAQLKQAQQAAADAQAAAQKAEADATAQQQATSLTMHRCRHHAAEHSNRHQGEHCISRDHCF